MAIETTGISTEVPVLPQVELIDSDGEPLDSEWHRFAINVLIESLLSHLLQQRDDFYVGGNMFVYFSEEQARNRDFRGLDFFFVDHVNRPPMRQYWAVWQEGGRYPDIIVELLSPSTTVEDRTTKEAIYEQIFHTSEYYCYDPYTQQLEGWRLVCGRYQPIEPNEPGWLWCERLNLWLWVLGMGSVTTTKTHGSVFTIPTDMSFHCPRRQLPNGPLLPNRKPKPNVSGPR